jgi:hypothetical protein
MAAVLLPVFSFTRRTIQSERCLANLRQLTSAWLIYASANDDNYCNNYGVSQNGNAPPFDSWCYANMDWSAAANSQDTNQNLLRVGQLAPYAGRDTTHFKCPADTYLSPAQVKAGFQSRVRSYSMSAFFGHFSRGSDATYQGKNEFDNNYRQFVKITDVPEPSSMLVFLEEHPDSINDGCYDVGDIPTKWTASTIGAFGDVPGSLHSGSGGFSFSDGHAEMHRWQDLRKGGTGISGLPVTYSGQGNIFDASPFSDIHWVWAHSSIPFATP